MPLADQKDRAAIRRDSGEHRGRIGQRRHRLPNCRSHLRESPGGGRNGAQASLTRDLPGDAGAREIYRPIRSG